MKTFIICQSKNVTIPYYSLCALCIMLPCCIRLPICFNNVANSMQNILKILFELHLY